MTFAGIHKQYATAESSLIWLQSIPYNGASTWGKGANKGFISFLEAAENMELFDIETQYEVYKKGIHILPEIMEKESPEKVFNKVYNTTKVLLKSEKFLTFFGGDHSISIGILKAFYEYYNNLTILQLDAHADLQPEYMGSKYSHACSLYEASLNTNLVQVGIRSMDSIERGYINKDQCYFARDIAENDYWVDQSIEQMGKRVYITLDLDVLDPSIMPSTGTPEPGGLSWYTITNYLKRVFSNREVVGFDIVELAPIRGLSAPNFLVAKLYYKMLNYKYFTHGT